MGPSGRSQVFQDQRAGIMGKPFCALFLLQLESITDEHFGAMCLFQCTLNFTGNVSCFFHQLPHSWWGKYLPPRSAVSITVALGVTDISQFPLSLWQPQEEVICVSVKALWRAGVLLSSLQSVMHAVAFENCEFSVYLGKPPPLLCTKTEWHKRKWRANWINLRRGAHQSLAFARWEMRC